MMIRHCCSLLKCYKISLPFLVGCTRPVVCSKVQSAWIRYNTRVGRRPEVKVRHYKSLPFVCLGAGILFQKSSGPKQLWWKWLVAQCNARTLPEDILQCGHSHVHRDSILILLLGKLYSATFLFLRTISLFLRFFPLLCLYPLTFVIPRSRSLWWMGLLVAMESAGPSFIKLGQWASTRRDLFSEEFCDRFSVFHHQVAYHKWRHTDKRLTVAFGPDWRNLFISFKEDCDPVGSGCVAQVYKAYFDPDKVDAQIKQRLSENSEEEPAFIRHIGIPVAVKVCHPDIAELIERDLTIMRYMAACLTFCLPSLQWLSLTECVREFSQLMEKQLDLVNEARCLDKFAANFSSCPQIFVPTPIWPYVTREVLVETFEEGEHISTFIQNKQCPMELKKILAELGVGALMKMVFVDNFIHGDLHPGNILVQNADKYKKQGSSSKKRVRLVLLDVGITASMKESDKHKFVEVFKAVVRGKGEEVARLFLTQSRISKCRNPAEFTREMTKLVHLAREEAASLGKVMVGSLLSQVFGLMIEHRIKVESNFASVILAIAVLEGLGRSLNPELNILKSARPFLLPNTALKEDNQFRPIDDFF